MAIYVQLVIHFCLAELLQVDIIHHYMNNVVNYTVYKPRRKLTFHSNKDHFW